MLDSFSEERDFNLPLPVQCDWAVRCLDFVLSIGIPVMEVRCVEGFLPAIRVEAGGLLVDPSRCFPGDILHEAGHVATMPAQFRPLACGDLMAANTAMSAWLDANPTLLEQMPEDPVARGCLQCGEAEATAWQYAAAVAMGLPEEWIFPVDGYEGQGRATLHGLRTNCYLGINGLQTAGWTHVRMQIDSSLPVYPSMARWLAP